MAAVTTFHALAESTGVVLPESLRRLIDDGKTRYGLDLDDWRKNWRAYSLSGRPVLTCAYDFEWIGAEKSREISETWLNPQFQHGRKFLPIAISGAGDAYCLISSPDGQNGMGMIWHDSKSSKIDDASFDAFVCRVILESALDLEQALDDYSLEEARQCLLANIHELDGYLAEPFISILRTFSQATVDGDEEVMATAAQTALELLPRADGQPFAVVPAWECTI